MVANRESAYSEWVLTERAHFQNEHYQSEYIFRMATARNSTYVFRMGASRESTYSEWEITGRAHINQNWHYQSEHIYSA